ncbi:MAG TPA: hypothetical protein VJ924_03320 [Alphaproteobacteria bacterium]|nr:hypothetical protein [Alphaproteobacteria bacterium]
MFSLAAYACKSETPHARQKRDETGIREVYAFNIILVGVLVGVRVDVRRISDAIDVGSTSLSGE